MTQPLTGTHGVQDTIVTRNERNEITVTITYTLQSRESGALLQFISSDGDTLDFSRSAILALDRNTPAKYSVPIDLFPGQYRILAYDIENDGTLNNGVVYPAVNGN